MTIIQFNQKRAKKDDYSIVKIATDIEAMAEIQSRVNATNSGRHRATKEQALIAKIITNLESQLKAAEKLEVLKAAEAGLRKDLADYLDVKKRAEKAAEAKARKAAKARAEKELLKAIDKIGLSVEDVKEKLGI